MRDLSGFLFLSLPFLSFPFLFLLFRRCLLSQPPNLLTLLFLSLSTPLHRNVTTDPIHRLDISFGSIRHLKHLYLAVSCRGKAPWNALLSRSQQSSRYRVLGLARRLHTPRRPSPVFRVGTSISYLANVHFRHHVSTVCSEAVRGLQLV